MSHFLKGFCSPRRTNFPWIPTQKISCGGLLPKQKIVSRNLQGTQTSSTTSRKNGLMSSCSHRSSKKKHPSTTSDQSSHRCLKTAFLSPQKPRENCKPTQLRPMGVGCSRRRLR